MVPLCIIYSSHPFCDLDYDLLVLLWQQAWTTIFGTSRASELFYQLLFLPVS